MLPPRPRRSQVDFILMSSPPSSVAESRSLATSDSRYSCPRPGSHQRALWSPNVAPSDLLVLVYMPPESTLATRAAAFQKTSGEHAQLRAGPVSLAGGEHRRSRRGWAVLVAEGPRWRRSRAPARRRDGVESRSVAGRRGPRRPRFRPRDPSTRVPSKKSVAWTASRRSKRCPILPLRFHPKNLSHWKYLDTGAGVHVAHEPAVRPIGSSGAAVLTQRAHGLRSASCVMTS